LKPAQRSKHAIDIDVCYIAWKMIADAAFSQKRLVAIGQVLYSELIVVQYKNLRLDTRQTKTKRPQIKPEQ